MSYLYCGDYCHHNADGTVCECPPCRFLRNGTGFQHDPGCPQDAETVQSFPPPITGERADRITECLETVDHTWPNRSLDDCVRLAVKLVDTVLEWEAEA